MIERVKRFLKELVGFIRNVTQDSRIPAEDKKILVALGILIVSPVDFIPDWIPVLGQIDDVIILGLVLDYFFRVLDEDIVLSHFPWSLKQYIRLKRIAQMISFFVPGILKKKLWKYVGAPY